MLDINEAKDFVKNNLFRKNMKNELTSKISASQIRKFLSAVNKINNKIRYQNNDDILSEDIVAEIAYMRIQFAYIVGKNKGNKELEKLHEKLDNAMANIKNSKSNFINFAKYVEAIVAYHKFYGGRD